jgi:hypothetical protein
MAGRGSANMSHITNDGGDHTHRERVAEQYKISSVHKKKIKPYLFLSAFLVVASSTYAALFHHVMLDPSHFPFPIWSIMWLVGLLPLGFGVKSLTKSSTNEMGLCIRGIYFFVFGGMAWGIYDNVSDIVHLIKEGKPHAEMNLISGVPSVIGLFFLISVSLFAHFTVIKHGKVLLKAWNTQRKR